ncbi:DivIVA domain-containing protein [Gemmatimonadota bacterium]
MKITPLELRKPDFKHCMRGYNPDEVDAMLSSAADALEEMIRENKELKDKYAAIEDKIKTYQNMENTLNETLILAQKASDSARQAAQREAELITARAEVEAEKILEDARARQMKLKLETEELEHQKQAYMLRLRSLVASQWKLLQEEREEEEKLQDLIKTESGEEAEGPIEKEPESEAAESEEVAVEKKDENKAAEEGESEAGEQAAQPEAVSQELGEVLDEASTGKKKGKSRKKRGAPSIECGKEDSAEPGESTEEDNETQANPNLFWGDETHDQEDSDKSDK